MSTVPIEKLTPMLRQYVQLKEERPDVVLLMRVGDFYEAYGEDAETIARELEITLTGREIQGLDERFPMAGVPFHALDRYLARLVQKGFKVAICDQVEDPKLAKGLVKRRVTRVVTPGTLVEDALLDAKSNNYLVAAIWGEPVCGVGVVDVSTGEFLVTEIPVGAGLPKIVEEIVRLCPAECLIPEGMDDLADAIRDACPATLTRLGGDALPRAARTQLLEHFGTTTLRGFGCDDFTAGLDAAAALLGYLKATHMGAVAHIRTLATYSVHDAMTLDAPARRNLELTAGLADGSKNKSLLSVLDATQTPMGGRLLKKWLDAPLLSVARIEERLDAVEAFFNDPLVRGDVRDTLRGVADLERLMARISTGTANARDLLALRVSLARVPDLAAQAAPLDSPALRDLLTALDGLPEVSDLLARAIVDEPPLSLREGNLIRDGFDADLDELREISRGGKSWIAEMEAAERARTGIKSLKVGYNAVFGYYIEVSRPNLPQAPPEYIRKQTTANGERFITPELKEMEARVLGAEEKITAREYDLFCGVRDTIATHAASVLQVAQAVARLDVLAALAHVAQANRYVRPLVDGGDVLEIKAGRHPVVEKLSGATVFIPNDVLLDAGPNQLHIITGPNMAGKCVRGDTLVFTDRGMVSIADVMPPGAPVGTFSEIACQVQGRAGVRQATHFYNGGRKATLRLTTGLGYQIEGTPEHRVWVRHRDGSEGWKCLGDVAEGDVVALDRRINLWGDETRIDPSLGETSPRARRHRLPEQLDEDLAYLMGLLIGDGTLTYRDGFLLSTADGFLADELRRIICRLFDRSAGCKRNGKDFFLCSRQIRDFLAGLGLGYGQAHQKSVPRSILRAPRRIVAAFLQGLFDTDGYAGNRYGYVQLATTSERLAREVQLLLLNFGLIASLRRKETKCKPSYEVSIYGEDAIAFHRIIGFRLPRKQVRQELASGLRMPNIGGIPYLNDTLKQVQKRIVATRDKPVALKKNKRVNSIFYTYVPSGRNLSYRKLDELITYCGENGVACSELETLRTTRYFYDRIRTVEASEAEVYDLSVEVDHAYIAGGFVSHNSTVLRQVALIVLLAQVGAFVPADHARIGLVDRIFTRVGAHDDLASGQSTFMVEMTETADILNNATERSLVVLDEIGRGTSTYDGLSIAWAVAEFLAQRGCKTLFATHYHHLNDLEKTLANVRNFRIAVKETGDRIVWLRKIVAGGTDKSYGIQVGRMAGLPPSVIARAQEVLADLEKTDRADRAKRDTVAPRAHGIAAKTQRLQMTLFEAEAHPVLEQIRRADLSTLSPIEALNLLYQLQKDAKEK